MPLILVLFWFYFLVPLVIGRPVGSLAAALIAFVLFEAAFYCEIIRSAIGSVRAGQTEAALATGMRPWQVMRHIILPQGLKAMTPLLLNQIIIVFQDTSLVYVVALRDFMTTASVVASRDGRPTEMYTLVAVVYLAICFSLSKAVERYGKGPRDDDRARERPASPTGAPPSCATAARPSASARWSSSAARRAPARAR